METNVGRFDGDVAFVTGAGSGIGRAVAIRLAGEGAKVTCFDKNLPAAEATVALIGQPQGDGILAIEGDVRSRGDIERALESTLQSFGKVTLLVNNAGVVTMHGLADLTEDEWDYVVDINLKGQFLVTQVVSTAMARSGGGAIVNLSTVEAEVVVASGPHCQPHYNASKGGVRMLTKALAHELAPLGIRVNAVAPGPTATAFSGVDLKSEEMQRFFNSRMLIPRPAEPEEVAAAIAFLLSPDASYITGVQLPVDGGLLVH